MKAEKVFTRDDMRRALRAAIDALWKAADDADGAVRANRCDCGSALTRCSNCAIADYQAAHPECRTCCPVAPSLSASDIEWIDRRIDEWQAYREKYPAEACCATARIDALIEARGYMIGSGNQSSPSHSAPTSRSAAQEDGLLESQTIDQCREAIIAKLEKRRSRGRYPEAIAVNQTLDDVAAMVLEGDFDALIAAVRRSGEPGWQPIETAPKDGTHILGFWPSVPDYPRDAPEIDRTYFSAGEWRDPDHGDDDYGYSAPTHWMPLPSPPHRSGEPT